MIDKVLAREVLLGHRAVPVVLVSKVAMQIDLRGHHGFSRQIHALSAIRHRYFTASSNASERSALDDERRILDGRRPITSDQPGAFEYDRCGRLALPVRLPCTRGHEDAHAQCQ